MTTLYLGIGRSVLVAPHVDAQPHSHRALEIVLALDAPFSVQAGKGERRQTRGVAFASEHRHGVGGFSGLQASIHMAPERWRAATLQRLFPSGRGVRFLDEVDLSAYMAFFRDLHVQDVGPSRVFEVCENLLEHLTGVSDIRGPVDERLLAVLDIIQRDIAGRISSHRLAREVFLSETRFLHLFRDQMGMPLRPYILHQRVMRASAAILDRASVTRAAHDAGFSDSSHFSRWFRAFTGLRPSQMKRLQGKARIFVCSSSRCVRGRAREGAGSACQRCGFYRNLPADVVLPALTADGES